MTEVHSFGIEPITCHALSSAGTNVAISPNNNEVHIYKREGKNWNRSDLLNQHDLRITSIDWAPKSNRIVTCSADRNAYVWFFEDKIWKPTLVLLRINRAATCVRWSPKEDKFAVGSGAKLISVCYFEEAYDWWVSKHIKKPIRSTVTCLDWHPENVLLAAGSTDFKTKIFSAYIKEVDKRVDIPSSAWGGKLNSTGNLIGEFSSGGGGWVYSVSFSPNGNRLAWVSHDSSLSLVDVNRGMNVITIRTHFLPYLTCLWSSNCSIVTAGHDCCPMLYKYDDVKGRLEFVEKIDKSRKKEIDGMSAMRKFQNADKRGFDLELSSSSTSSSSLDTIHQNSIKELRVFAWSSKGTVTKISSVGLDGRLVLWDI